MNQSLVWFRRDLRLHDHHALWAACKNSDAVHLVFVFDTNILSKLENKSDRRVTFIIESLTELEIELNKLGSSLHILYGDPVIEIPKLAKLLKVDAVHANRDYEPKAITRDRSIFQTLKDEGIVFHGYKDQVIFEKKEILNNSSEVYKVFTPYKNKWLTALHELGEPPQFKPNLKKLSPFNNPNSILLQDWFPFIGFQKTNNEFIGGVKQAKFILKQFDKKIDNYHLTRDQLFVEGTSHISPYLRHGCVSIRELVIRTLKDNNPGKEIWLNELIWRDFYQMILATHPYVEHAAFKSEYNKIKWRGKSAHFKAWCEGNTGFPIIDASMRCLNQTGLMPNRARMIVASFLCKILLIDWKKGEKYFAEKLLDYDLAANNGGWQWSSSSGCDAQPYFRIFNPYTQTKKFDPDLSFIKKFCTLDEHYPKPIVSYEDNRKLCLEMYQTR